LLRHFAGDDERATACRCRRVREVFGLRAEERKLLRMVAEGGATD